MINCHKITHAPEGISSLFADVQLVELAVLIQKRNKMDEDVYLPSSKSTPQPTASTSSSEPTSSKANPSPEAGQSLGLRLPRLYKNVQEEMKAMFSML